MDHRGYDPVAGSRNTTLFFCNVSNLRVENLKVLHQRWWGITNVFMRNSTFRNIVFQADLSRAALGEFEMEQGYWVEGKDADIHDVKIRNVSSDPYVCSIVRLLNENGHQLYNVEIQGVTDLRQNEAYQSQNTVRIGDLFVLARRALPCP